jgi:hypothetical protein
MSEHQPLSNRTYLKRNNRNLREYLEQAYPGIRYIKHSGGARTPLTVPAAGDPPVAYPRLPLIVPNPGAVGRAGGDVSPQYGGLVMGHVDAVVVHHGKVQLWDSRDALTATAIRQLEGYCRLWPASYAGVSVDDLRVSKHLLVANDRPAMARPLADSGIVLHVSKPAWYAALEEHARGLQARTGLVGLNVAVAQHASRSRLL